MKDFYNEHYFIIGQCLDVVYKEPMKGFLMRERRSAIDSTKKLLPLEEWKFRSSNECLEYVNEGLISLRPFHIKIDDQTTLLERRYIKKIKIVTASIGSVCRIHIHVVDIRPKLFVVWRLLRQVDILLELKEKIMCDLFYLRSGDLHFTNDTHVYDWY